MDESEGGALWSKKDEDQLEGGWRERVLRKRIGIRGIAGIN